MANIHIKWLTDEHDCETCGTSFAEGAQVYVEGELVVDMQPSAHCYGDASYPPTTVLLALIRELGHELSETNS